MENLLSEIFSQVEKHSMALMGSISTQGLSRDENRILALQNVNRLNQRIGFLAREYNSKMGELRILQTYVNSLTLGIKSDNIPQMKSALFSMRNILNDFNLKSESQSKP